MKQNETFPYGALLVILLCAGMLLSLLHPSRTFSAAENRQLQQRVMPWEESVLDQDYQDAVSAFVSDQFPRREGWMQLRSDILAALQEKNVEDVYIANDDSLIQAFTPDMALGKKQVEAVNDFAARHEDMAVSLLLAPTRIAFAADTISRDPSQPLQRDVYDELCGMLDESVSNTDVWDTLQSHQDEYIYFYSDHHWTPLGAKYAAQTFLGETLDDYESVNAVSGFHGSLSRQIAWTHAQDDLQLQLPKEETPYTVEDPAEETTTTTLYDSDALSSADPYTVFFGGNAPLLRIDAALANGKRLLIVKDSYANAFIPYLIPCYEEIVIVDPRYYYDDLEALIESEEITETMFLFNMNTFTSDDSLQQMLGR